MAEGGGSHGDHEQSNQISGNDCVYDFYCELCSDDGLNAEADGYCQDCGEYMCSSCIDVHSKYRRTRNHDVLDQAFMPKDTPLSQDRVSKYVSTKCPSHKSKPVEFYCLTHATLGCSTCFSTVHKKCADIESIHDRADTILDSQEYNEFAGDLKEIGQTSRDTISRTRDDVYVAEKGCKQTIGNIRTLKEEYIAIFEELEQSLVAQIEAMKSADKANVDRIGRELTQIASTVDVLKDDFGTLVSSKRLSQLYIRMRETKGEVTSLKQKLKSVQEGTEVRSFAFEPNSDIRDAIKTSGLGILVTINSTRSANDNTAIASAKADKAAAVIRNDRNTTATHIVDIDVSSSGRLSRDCCIISSVMLSNTRLIALDSNNNSVKLVDTRSNALIGELKVSAQPFDVTVINDKQVAVSTWGCGKIYILNVNGGFSLERELSVGIACHGVSFYQDSLFVSFYDEPRLEKIYFNGNTQILRNNSDGNGFNNFDCPVHVCVSKDGERVYMSDFCANKLFCLALDGQLKSVYTELQRPYQMCEDHCGNVYIADGSSCTVHMVTADCKKIKEVLTQADGLTNDVRSVSHCGRTNRLYVGMNGSNVVKVYQLS